MNPHPLRNGLLFLVLLLLPAAAWASADTTAPSISSIVFAPDAVDVSSSAANVSFNVEATDDSSGVDNIYLVFTSPDGKSSFEVNMSEESRISGTPLDGIYNGDEQVNSCDEAGTWTLTSVQISDECGNSTRYEATASGSVKAFPAGTATTLVVTNSNTIPSAPPAPVATSFTYTPNSVDLTTNNHSITVTVTGSNFSYGSYAFVDPSGTHYAYSSIDNANDVAGVTGTFTDVVTFAPCDPGGTWKLSYIDLSNYTGACSDSFTSYSPTKLPANTPETTVTVNNPDADVTAPAMTSLMLSSTAVDVTNGSVAIDGTMGVTDNLSGASYADIYYTGPGGKTIGGQFYAYSPTTDGNLTGPVSFNTCTPPGTYTLSSVDIYDSCGNEAEYTPASKPTFPVGTPAQIMVTNAVSSTGSLEVDLDPYDVEYYGGGWYLDSDSSDLQYSGSVITGISPGMHTVNFTPDTNPYSGVTFTTPASQNINIVANQPAYTTGTYVSSQSHDSIQVNILPSSLAGAEWNVDGGPLQPSGAMVNVYVDGQHTIEFSGVNGYIAPGAQIVTTGNDALTVTTGTYTVPAGFGSLKVNLAPPGAIAAGAMWSVNGTPESSGATVSNLAAGPYTVTFSGGGTAYAPPASQDVVVSANQTTTTSGTFTALTTGTGSLTVTILPSAANTAGAEWNVDGGASMKSGQTVAGLSGTTHMVNFTMANGYIPPASQSIAIVPDETVSTSGTYTKAPPFVGVAQSFAGLSSSGYAYLTAILADTGKFSGKLITADPSTYSLSGSLNSAGYFSGTAKGKPALTYSVQVTGSTAGTYLFTLSEGSNQITANPAAYSKGQTAAEEGVYTALLTGTDPSIAIPQGTGYARVTVKGAGAGSIAGRLADGTGFSSSSILVAGTAGNQLIVFDPKLYKMKGAVSGVLNFGMPMTGEFEGALLWQKPAGKPTFYPAAFQTTLNAAGALYVKTAPVPFTSGTLTFGAGLLPVALQQPFTVTSTGVVTMGSPNPFDVKLKVKVSNGAISGSFKPDITGVKKPIGFTGVLLQDPNVPRAAGFFLGPVISGTSLSGNVTLP